MGHLTLLITQLTRKGRLEISVMTVQGRDRSNFHLSFCKVVQCECLKKLHIHVYMPYLIEKLRRF